MTSHRAQPQFHAFSLSLPARFRGVYIRLSATSLFTGTLQPGIPDRCNQHVLQHLVARSHSRRVSTSAYPARSTQHISSTFHMIPPNEHYTFLDSQHNEHKNFSFSSSSRSDASIEHDRHTAQSTNEEASEQERSLSSNSQANEPGLVYSSLVFL